MAYTKLRFNDAVTVGSFQRDNGSYVVSVTRENDLTGGDQANRPTPIAVVYSAVLNEDIDGAPNCYGRFTPANPIGNGLDSLKNATNHGSATQFNPLAQGLKHHPWRWVGVMHKSVREAAREGIPRNLLHEIPELAALHESGSQQADPQFPVLRDDNENFYVSTTALVKNASAAVTNPSRYYDATTVDYAALTPPLTNLGVALGDFGIAIRRDTGTSRSFLFADSGNGNKVGEVSRRLFRALVPGGQEDHLVAFIVFPGSRRQSDKAASIRSRLAELSQAANVDVMIGLMASANSYVGSVANEQVWLAEVDGPRHKHVSEMLHRAPDLDVYARPFPAGSSKFQTIANALRPYGYDSNIAAAAAAEAAAAERPGLKLDPAVFPSFGV